MGVMGGDVMGEGVTRRGHIGRGVMVGAYW